MKNQIIAGLLITTTAIASTAHNPDTLQVANTLNEVVVTGSNVAINRNLLPYTVSVVNSKQLEASPGNRVLSTLSGMVPGLFVTERGILGFGVSNGGSGHIKMRGVGGDRASAVLMMVDGQPQFAGIYSHHIADFYTKDYVERVEVVRGPSSVLYGSNAMAGTINVVTRQAEKNGAHATLSSEYGSYNTWQSNAMITARYGRFSALINGSYDRTDGSIKGMSFNQGAGYAKVAYNFSDAWRAQADYSLMHFVNDDPVYPTLSNPESKDVYHQDVTRGEVSVAAGSKYDNTDGTYRVYYSYGNHFIDDPRHFHSTDDRFGVLLYQNFTPADGTALTVGFDFDTYRGEIPVSGGTEHKPGALGTISPKSITEYSPYVTAAQSLFGDVLRLNAGVRMANSDKFDTRWVPQAGFAVNTSMGYVFKGSAAMGYRNPSFRELYLYRMANPELQPERMWNYEVSVGKCFGSWLTLDFTAYFCEGSNIIQVVDMHNENTGSFRNKGIEISALSEVTDRLTLNATYSYLCTSLDNLVGAPRNMYFLGARWQALKWLNVDARLKGVGGLFVADTMHRQNYALLGFKFTAKVWRHLDLSLHLDNVTDARYTINRGYTMPGFNAMGGFTFHI